MFRDKTSYTVDSKTDSKGQVVRVHAMKAYGGSRGIAP
jgi:hypothetical protein